MNDATRQRIGKRLLLRLFRPEDQEPVRALILAGLGEHWGSVDESVNEDLHDIAASYSRAVFLVALVDGAVVGTGALVPRDAKVGEIVRMSVMGGMRRAGLGTAILARLMSEAAKLHLTQLVLETTASWQEVIQFYVANGFTISHNHEGLFGTETWLVRCI